MHVFQKKNRMDSSSTGEQEVNPISDVIGQVRGWIADAYADHQTWIITVASVSVGLLVLCCVLCCTFGCCWGFRCGYSSNRNKTNEYTPIPSSSPDKPYNKTENKKRTRV